MRRAYTPRNASHESLPQLLPQTKANFRLKVHQWLDSLSRYSPENIKYSILKSIQTYQSDSNQHHQGNAAQLHDDIQYILMLSSVFYPNCGLPTDITQVNQELDENSDQTIPYFEHYKPDLIDHNTQHFNTTYAPGRMRVSQSEKQTKADIREWLEVIKHDSLQIILNDLMLSFTHENNSNIHDLSTLHSMLAFSMSKFPGLMPNIANYMVKYDLSHAGAHLAAKYIDGEAHGLVYTNPYDNNHTLGYYLKRCIHPPTASADTQTDIPTDDMGDGAGDGERDDTDAAINPDTAPRAGAGGDAGAGAGEAARPRANARSAVASEVSTDRDDNEASETGAGYSFNIEPIVLTIISALEIFQILFQDPNISLPSEDYEPTIVSEMLSNLFGNNDVDHIG